jgi:hypothetical protein
MLPRAYKARAQLDSQDVPNAGRPAAMVELYHAA